MNWGEFKNKLSDSVEIVYIDIECSDELDDVKVVLLQDANSFYVKNKLGLNDVTFDE